MLPSSCRGATAISSGGGTLKASDLRDPLALLATGFGTGLSPYAPGTAGSLLAVLIWWFAFAELPLVARAAIALVAFGLGVLLVERVVRRYDLGDAPAIVWDEIAGCWLALAVVPKSWPWVVAAFVLFRLGDIAKPWPVSWADRSVPGGLGIMLDDFIAGGLVAVVLAVVLRIL